MNESEKTALDAAAVRAIRHIGRRSGALLVNYAFSPNWSLGGRVEYIGADNNSFIELYGPGSNAWSVTITPTYQYKVFFARADVSYVGLGSATTGLEFGVNANRTSQVRGLLEAGIIF